MSKHTDAEIRAASRRLEKWLDEADPATIEWEETSDLRDLARAVDAQREADVRIRELVAAARANGRSWGDIGVALGVSRQAAHERFAERVKA